MCDDDPASLRSAGAECFHEALLSRLTASCYWEGHLQMSRLLLDAAYLILQSIEGFRNRGILREVPANLLWSLLLQPYHLFHVYEDIVEELEETDRIWFQYDVCEDNIAIIEEFRQVIWIMFTKGGSCDTDTLEELFTGLLKGPEVLLSNAEASDLKRFGASAMPWLRARDDLARVEMLLEETGFPSVHKEEEEGEEQASFLMKESELEVQLTGQATMLEKAIEERNQRLARAPVYDEIWESLCEDTEWDTESWDELVTNDNETGGTEMPHYQEDSCDEEAPEQEGIASRTKTAAIIDRTSHQREMVLFDISSISEQT